MKRLITQQLSPMLHTAGIANAIPRLLQKGLAATFIKTKKAFFNKAAL
jgi:hypothetical protein